jgi:hypothetical protein
MKNVIRSRPSPAIVIAVLALVAAVAGTAVADPGASSSALTKAKVKQIAKKQANKQINKQLPWGPEDIATGAVVAPKLGAVETRSTTVLVPAGEYREATANCQPGERVLSGGVKWNNVNIDENFPHIESYKEGEGWYARVQNAFASDRSVTVEAYCLAV